MKSYTVFINGRRWHGEARSIASAVRMAASVLGVALNECGVRLTVIKWGV